MHRCGLNSIERVSAAIAFDPTDRVPVIAQVFGHAAHFCGVPLSEYLRDGATLARCQIEAQQHYNYDAVFALMDVNVETEAVGSRLDYYQDDYFTVREYALTPDTDFSQLQVPNPHRAGRMPELLHAAKTLREEVGEEVLVVGHVSGPLTLASQLLGIEQALYLAADSPSRFEQLLDFATELSATFGEAQIQAGVHLPVVFDPVASPAVVPPQYFREIELPRLERLFAKLNQSGAAASWLHIAGPAAPILPAYPLAGVDIANFDYYVTAEEAASQLPRTCVDGNIQSMAFESESPDVIAELAADLMASFAARAGFILSSGCEIPPRSKVENIEAMIGASLHQSQKTESRPHAGT